MTPISKGTPLPLATAGMVGMAVGACVLGFSLLPHPWSILSIIAMLFCFVTIIVRNVEKLLLAVVLLEIPIGLHVHFLKTETEWSGTTIGLNVSVTTLCLTALFALWFAQLLAKATKPLPKLLHKSLPFTIYFLAVLSSIVVAQDAQLASFKIFLVFQGLLLYIYMIKAVQNKKDVLFAVSMLMVGLVLQSFIMIGVGLTGFDLEFASISTDISAVYGARVGGTMGSATAAAGYLTLFLAPALGLFLAQSSRVHTWLAALAFGSGMIALFLTQARGGLLAFVISIGLFYSLTFCRGWLSLKMHLIVIASILILFLFAPFQTEFVDRIFGDDGGAAESRISLLRLALQIIQDHPLFGVGANNFGVAATHYITPQLTVDWIAMVHNKYLLEWAESGISALAAFVWFLITTLQRGWKTWQLNDHLLSPLALGFTLAVAGQMAHMTVDVFNSRSLIYLLCVVAGLTTAMSSIKTASSQNSAISDKLPSDVNYGPGQVGK